jgi:hypothetical protein
MAILRKTSFLIVVLGLGVAALLILTRFRNRPNAAMKHDFIALNVAAQELIKIWRESGKDVWTRADDVPVGLQPFNAQATQIFDLGTSVVVQVKITTGFSPSGLVIVVEPTNALQSPDISVPSRLIHLTNNIWRY